MNFKIPFCFADLFVGSRGCTFTIGKNVSLGSGNEVLF